METTVTNFWSCFIRAQLDILFAYNRNDEEMVYARFKQLNEHPVIIENKLNLLMFLPTEDKPKASLFFLTRGMKKRKHQASLLVKQAPKLDKWVYHVGIPPYQDKDIPFHVYFPFINEIVYEHQVFVHIHKIYKSSNKLHLQIYIDLNRTGVPKNEIKPFARDMLFYYFGEDMYYKHISMIKIVRRKLTKINYFPLRDLKNLLQFQSPN